MFGIMLCIFFFNEKKVVLTLWKFNEVSPPRHYTQKLRMAPNRRSLISGQHGLMGCDMGSLSDSR